MTSQQKPLDAYYTPAWLAAELAAALPDQLVGAVMDPSVGAGALLSAVENRFGDKVALLGLDVDRKSVRALRETHPEWTISHADFLSGASRRSSRAWRTATDGVAAVVLNPPYSYRGNGGDFVTYESFAGRVAPSMRFLVEVLADLRPSVGVYAVLPDGAIDAERHDPLWAAIKNQFEMSRLQRFKTTSFHGARVATSLVRLTPGAGADADLIRISSAFRTPVPGCRCVEVIRGRVPVHAVRGTRPNHPSPFLHTTNVRSSVPRMTAPKALSDEGPFLIVNRVGRWDLPVTLDVGRAVLSDCLFALRPRSRSQIDVLRDSLVQAHEALADEFRGTGAQYITITRLVRQLEHLGWHPHVVRASSPVEACCCGMNETVECLEVENSGSH